MGNAFDDEARGSVAAQPRWVPFGVPQDVADSIVPINSE